MTLQPKTFLVTGGLGCLGAWTLYHLVKQGQHAVCFDLSDNRHRLRLLLTPEEQQRITFVHGDLRDFAQVQSTFAEHAITHVIHLAALQIPFCKADPVQGAQVNVVGTVNVFEAARLQGIKHLAQASSIAVYGPPGAYTQDILPDDAPFDPRTLYGVYKVATENIARVYWEDHTLSSIALRPYTVYGVARDRGLTSEPTRAMLAAAAGHSSHISFSGRMQFHFASDIARQFIDAAQNPLDGVHGFNLGSLPVAVADVAQMIEAAKPGVKVTTADKTLPFPAGFQGKKLERYAEHVYATPIEDGIRQTIAHFERALAGGLITYDEA